jgi:hypothetical protein
MNDVYYVDSVYIHGDWDIVLGIVKDLLEGNSVVAVKRFVDGRYISTFYFTHSK